MLLDESGVALMAKSIGVALGGDGIMLRDCLKKLIGTRRGQPLVLDDVADFPEVKGPEDLAAAAAAITRALAEGRVTPEEAARLSEMLHGFRPAFAARAEPPAEELDDPLEEIERRLDRLARRIERDEREAADERAKAGDAEVAAMMAAWTELREEELEEA